MTTGSGQPGSICPRCGAPLTWSQQYQQWWCNQEQLWIHPQHLQAQQQGYPPQQQGYPPQQQGYPPQQQGYPPQQQGAGGSPSKGSRKILLFAGVGVVLAGIAVALLLVLGGGSGGSGDEVAPDGAKTAEALFKKFAKAVTDRDVTELRRMNAAGVLKPILDCKDASVPGPRYQKIYMMQLIRSTDAKKLVAKSVSVGSDPDISAKKGEKVDVFDCVAKDDFAIYKVTAKLEDSPEDATLMALQYHNLWYLLVATKLPRHHMSDEEREEEKAYEKKVFADWRKTYHLPDSAGVKMATDVPVALAKAMQAGDHDAIESLLPTTDVLDAVFDCDGMVTELKGDARKLQKDVLREADRDQKDTYVIHPDKADIHDEIGVGSKLKGCTAVEDVTIAKVTAQAERIRKSGESSTSPLSLLAIQLHGRWFLYSLRDDD